MDSHPAPPSYRQEIRCVMRSDEQNQQNQNQRQPNSVQNRISTTETTISSSANNNNTEKELNRISRIHPQLQQQHIQNLWKHYLYDLQQKAPTPKRVICRYAISSRPSYYGREFHGIMAREEADQILLEEDGVDGRYLVRESARIKSQMTLSLRFNGMTKNFRLYYQQSSEQHYVNELKRFDTLHDLVADGLITLYVEMQGADYIANLANQCRYEESPYMTLHKGRLPVVHKASKTSTTPASSGSHPKQPLPPNSGVGTHPPIVHHPYPVVKPRPPSLPQNPHPPHPPPPQKQPNRRSMNVFDAIKQISIHDDYDDDDDQPELEHQYATAEDCAQETAPINVQAFEKTHNFRTHTFIGSPWCDFCGNFIWGLIQQGVRCDDCGFGAHRKCSELVPNDCCPDLRHIRRIFGIDLTTLVKASNTLRPFVIDLCIGEVERRGLDIEGIYRACGSNEEIEMLKNQMELNWEHLVIQSHLRLVEDLHVITGLLKLYLRLLPIPLITFDAYEYFIEAGKKSTAEQVITGLKDATSRLPPAHYQTLKFLVAHLDRKLGSSMFLAPLGGVPNDQTTTTLSQSSSSCSESSTDIESDEPATDEEEDNSEEDYSEEETESEEEFDQFDEEQFPKCRLCPELHRIGFNEIDRLYEQNRELSTFFIRPNVKICKCIIPKIPVDGAADGTNNSRKRYQQTRTHVVCLARWLRLTGDKTCPFCYSKFTCPDYIERLDTFWHFLRQNSWQVWLCGAFLNLWLLSIKYAFVLGTTSIDSDSSAISQLTLPHYLCFIVLFMNCFVLNYFFVVYRSRRLDQSLIRFSYRHGRIETCQMFSSKMVANWHATRNAYTLPGLISRQRNYRHYNRKHCTVNYGQLFDRCSWCGVICWHSSLYPGAGHNSAHYRYLCGCYVYHRKCLNQCLHNQYAGTSPAPLTTDSTVTPQFRRLLPTCPNCGELFRFPSTAKLLLCYLRDWIIKFRCRWGSNPGHRPSPLRFHYGQQLYYSPSYCRYLFTTSYGLRKLGMFGTVLWLYLVVEWICFWWSDQDILKVYQSISSLFFNSTQKQKTAAPTIETCFSFSESTTVQQEEPIGSIVDILWSLVNLRLLWFCYQFYQLSYRGYLDDLQRHQTKLGTSFEMLNLKRYFIKRQ